MSPPSEAPGSLVLRRGAVTHFLTGLVLAFVGSIAWQLVLMLVASFVAVSPLLRQHTRHQRDLALLLWLAGTGLHLLGLVLLIGRSRRNAAAGVWCALLLLLVLAWGLYQVVQVAGSLRD